MAPQYLSVTTLLPLLALGLTIVVQTGVICYAMGRLFQRVTSTEKRLAEQDKKIEDKIGDQNILVEKVVRLQVQMEHNTAVLEKLGHTMEGVNRQLGNIAMGRVGQGGEML